MTTYTKGFRTLTAGELIALLQEVAPDMPVLFSTNYGDYSRTEQALPVRGEVDTVTIVKSAYSNSGFAVGEPEFDEHDFEAATGTPYVPYLRIS